MGEALFRKFQVDTERVENWGINGPILMNHHYLILDVEGTEVIIDPTWNQYFHEKKPNPVFVGTRSQLEKIFKENAGNLRFRDDPNLESYFSNNTDRFVEMNWPFTHEDSPRVSVASSELLRTGTKRQVEYLRKIK